MERKSLRTDRISSYFIGEYKTLILVTVSGILYNCGLLTFPWFEGRLASGLMDILLGESEFSAMLKLVFVYVVAAVVVQGARVVKRFYVRRFANNVNRRMKKIIYHSTLNKSKAELEQEGVGSVMTKAISDADDCAEGMRKFTTEIFDTGVALTGYSIMLICYDWRLALICLIFPPISYLLAEKMKTKVQLTGVEYKSKAGLLNSDTLDRTENAVTYRITGTEGQINKKYEESLSAYEKAAVGANIWTSVFPPLYRIISMGGIIFILIFGARNVTGKGWNDWDIAAFTTFVSCYTKLSVKSSKAAKLFNSVHKAQVSWERIKPYMITDKDFPGVKKNVPAELSVKNLGFAYPGAEKIFDNLTFSAHPGQIVGVTGPVACGKSTLGRTFLCEYPYSGSVRMGDRELSAMPEDELRGTVSYMGHDPELLSCSIKDNILMGQKEDVEKYLCAVCFSEETANMEHGMNTCVGSGGIRLSGGQAQRLALARTLCGKKSLVILDDPFSALDIETERKVFENIKSICSDSIVLLISHRLYLFPELDSVIWMDNGDFTVGTHNELMKKVPSYARLYSAQKGGKKNEK